MSTAAIAEMVGLGAAFGAFGGFFGVGGGIIAIPMLVLLFNMAEQSAQGTALVMILPSVLMGFWKYQQRNSIDLRMAALLAASAALATYGTARLANILSSATLRWAFGAFLLVIALFLAGRMLRQSPPKTGRRTLGWRSSWLVGLSGGLLSGLFGIGGATIAPPALTTFFGLSQTAAQGLALAMIVPGTVVALAVYAHAGAVDWAMGLALATGGLMAVPLGVTAAHKLQPEKLRLLFCGFLTLSATMVIIGR